MPEPLYLLDLLKSLSHWYYQHFCGECCSDKSKTPVKTPIVRVAEVILVIRDEKVILDTDLALLYGVETRALIQAVKRNSKRFPLDFMFQLTRKEFDGLRSQFVISKGSGFNAESVR